jgi:hypothetical protein
MFSNKRLYTIGVFLDELIGKTDNFSSINPFEKDSTDNTDIFIRELFPYQIKNRNGESTKQAG